ncbi:MAG: threonylcarbamoyl-AMP synthase [Chlorobium sp.]|nr:L-threonylcarbamoyladenylate synthase [Chlorobium phaeovibrioides]NQU46099.1 threonylcarbamoyl-AMP synthase [Chlorobium sp.]
MKTLITDSPLEAAALLIAGKTVAFPTETVYGLGAAIDSPAAIAEVFKAKGRPQDNPLIVHISTPEELPRVASKLSPEAELLVSRFFPGPLTLVLPKSNEVPYAVTAGLDSVGVRCPAHPVAHEFLKCCHTPVAAPSANRSGRPSATSWEAVRNDLDGRIAAILKGSNSRIGLESTIVDCTGPNPVMLRAGAITLEELQEVIPAITPAGKTQKNEPLKSPGLKYPHYAPRATVVTHEQGKSPALTPDSAWIGLGVPPVGITIKKTCISLDEYAQELFSFFRHCDREAVQTIYCELPPEKGLGRAIRDRLNRAAGNH